MSNFRVRFLSTIILLILLSGSSQADSESPVTFQKVYDLFGYYGGDSSHIFLPAKGGGLISSIAWSPTMDYLAAVDASNWLHIWKGGSKVLLEELPIEGNYLTWSEYGLYLAIGSVNLNAEEPRVMIWDKQTLSLLSPPYAYSGGGHALHGMAWLEIDRLIILIDQGPGLLGMWDVSTQSFTILSEQVAITAYGNHFATSPDRRHIAAVTLPDHILTIWDFGNVSDQFPLSLDGVPSQLAWSPSGLYLAVDFSDLSLLIDAETGQEIAQLSTKGVIAWSPDERYLLVQHPDKLRWLKVIDLTDFSEVAEIEGEYGRWSQDGQWLITDGIATHGGMLLDASTFTSVRLVETDFPIIGQWICDTHYLITSGETELTVWDADTQEIITTLPNILDQVTRLIISSDCQYLAAAERSGHIQVWKIDLHPQ